MTYDAILLTSFGGPEAPEDVMPFLENVLRGKNVPHERMLEVAKHYYQFGGKSPINDQNRRLIAALEAELEPTAPICRFTGAIATGIPLLADTLQQMKNDGVRHALAFVTSAYSSYSGCRQYRENIAAAQQAVGTGAPEVDKLRAFYNHPGFIATLVDRVRQALAKLPEDQRDVGPPHLHRAQHPHEHGADQRLRKAIAGNRPVGGRSIRPQRLAPRLSEPQRPCLAALA